MKPTLARHLTLTAAVALAMNLFHVAVAVESKTPTIAIAPVSANLGDAAAFEKAGCGEELAQIFITELGRLSTFHVLENIDLQALKDEMKMGDDGWIEQKEKKEKGHFKGADYIFIVRVTRFGSSEKKFGGDGRFPIPRPRLPFLDLNRIGINQSEQEVQLDWRVVDGATRTVVKTGRGIGNEKGTSFDFASSRGSGYMQNNQFQSSAIGKATMKAVAAIVDELRSFQPPAGSPTESVVTPKTPVGTSGQVIFAKDAKVIISLGTTHGLKKGDKLGLYRVEETKDDDGTVVFTKNILVGEVELVDTDAERSEATYHGDIPARKGWVVKQLAAK